MTSFRLKLALLAGLLTGILIVGTGALAWRLTLRFNLDRLDRELRNLGAANLERVVGDSHWQRLDGALSFVSGSDPSAGYALWVETNGRELYRSPQWPQWIDPDRLPRPTAYEGGRTYDPIPPPPRPRDPISAANPALPRKEPYFVTFDSGDHAWRLGVMGSPYTTLVVAANIDGFTAELTQLRNRFLTTLPVLLLVVGGGAWFFAGRALRPVQALTGAVERVTARGLDQRLAVGGNDREFQRLITVFNAMMDRLETSFHQATRFSADASHELKTPLALLQLELEQALATTPAGAPQQMVYISLLEEVRRLKAIVQKLLLLSLADTGRLELHRESVNISTLLESVLEDASALAPQMTIEHSVPTGVKVDADAVLLEQAVQNLVGNAIKYNRPGGRVHLALNLVAGGIVITVGNSGPGIAPADQARIFDRFFRADAARQTSGSGGAGLGLSLSREIIRAHGGRLELARSEGDWTEFAATVPTSPQRRSGSDLSADVNARD